ncbi:MAG: antibiotic biosynthesis monooxygenase [Kordiimonadaceae bacterium]|nr:antibiotic biosynthesis monooxygenase [Kordiimonadaceae bacterium]
MIAVIFEAVLSDDKKEEYLEIASEIREKIELIDGFISVERFQSLSNPGKLLSLSFFENEDSVAKWRNLPAHRTAQSKGRAGIFHNYQLRVAHVVRNYGKEDRDQAPDDLK